MSMNINIRNRPKVLKIVVLGLALAGIVAWIAGKGRAEAEQSKPLVSRPALTVRTAMLREEKWEQTLIANGSILPWQEAVISAQVSGVRLAEVKVSIGDHVKRGDVLVTLDNFARVGDASRSAQGRIVAPYDGVISVVNANSGSMSQPGAELFRLIRKGRLEWRAELTANELMMLRHGMSAEITVGNNRVLKGKVRAISPEVDARTRYGYALVSLADSSGVIAGVYAHGTFDISGGKRALSSLPQSAVMRRGRDAYVLVVDSDNVVHERAVKLGQLSGDRIEVKQGIKPGEAVVETGGPFLTEGDVVRVVK